MKLSDLLLADNGPDTLNTLLSYFGNKRNVVVPSSFDDLFKKPFSSSSLTIIDYSFSENRGLEALWTLKKVKPSLPVIFTASYSTEDICLRAFRLGAQDYFTKPLVVKDFINSVNLILKYRKNKSRNRANILRDKYANGILADTGSKIAHPNIDKAQRYIESNYDKKIPLFLIAGKACMSKYHFCRTFRKQTGKTFTEYLNIMKIRKAQRILLASKMLSITEIAFLVGYNELSYFERTFKKIVGLSPSTYRNKVRGLNTNSNVS